MKKAIISGATGFIGASFVKFLTTKGIDVLALGRKTLDEVSESRKSKLVDAQYVSIDMSEIEQLDDKIKDLDWTPGEDCVFFNLAWGGVDRLSDLDVDAPTTDELEGGSPISGAENAPAGDENA